MAKEWPLPWMYNSAVSGSICQIGSGMGAKGVPFHSNCKGENQIVK